MSTIAALQPAETLEGFHRHLTDCLPHLRAYARAITGNRDIADDLVHDAVVRALAASHQFQPGTNFKAWMFTVLRNQNTSNFRRNRSATTPLEEISEDVYQAQPNQEERLTLKELERGVKALPRQRREALILVVVHGFSYEETARICRCAVGTVKSRVARARMELHDRLLGSGVEAATAQTEKGASSPKDGVKGEGKSRSRYKAAPAAMLQSCVRRPSDRFVGFFHQSSSL